MNTVRATDKILVSFGMIALVIGLLLLFFRRDCLTLAISSEDTCCKVQVQEKTGVTTTSIPSEGKNSIAPSRQSSDCVQRSCKTVTFSRVFLYHHRQIDSCLSAFQEKCSSSKVQLIFQNSAFSRNELSNDWITFAENLTIQSITFEDCFIERIQPGAFRSSIFLGTEQLQLINGNLSTFQSYIFQELSNLRNLAVQSNMITFADANSLSALAETLETLQLDSSVQNLDVLRNMTQAKFPKVQIVSLQNNNITFISKDILSAFPNLQSLYLDSSNILWINPDAFHGLNFIKQIFLRNNLLTELPVTVFDSILASNERFQVSLSNNPWKCDCSLVWLQKLMEKYPNLISTEPICASPEQNKDLGFLKANFCEETKILCNKSEELIEISINCLEKRKAISQGLSEVNVSLAGYDCVWKSVLITKNSEKSLWLSQKDKAIVLSLYTIGTVLFGVFCAVGTFLIVRNNPELLKGSKRVVMVKRGGVDAMVLPKGVKIASQRNKGEIDYLTPIEANEYESIGAGGGKEESKSDNCPPPLPPHPFHGVRTVSLLMDGIDGKREVIDDCLL